MPAAIEVGVHRRHRSCRAWLQRSASAPAFPRCRQSRRQRHVSVASGSPEKHARAVDVFRASAFKSLFEAVFSNGNETALTNIRVLKRQVAHFSSLRFISKHDVSPLVNGLGFSGKYSVCADVGPSPCVLDVQSCRKTKADGTSSGRTEYVVSDKRRNQVLSLKQSLEAWLSERNENGTFPHSYHRIGGKCRQVPVETSLSAIALSVPGKRRPKNSSGRDHHRTNKTPPVTKSPTGQEACLRSWR